MKSFFNLFILALMVICGLQACEDTSIEFEGYSNEQVGFILSADSIKTWQRESLLIDGQPQDISNCQQYLQLIFEITKSEDGTTDSTAIERISPVDGCAEEIIFTGDWQVAVGPQVDTLFFIMNNNRMPRFITDLTSQRLEFYYVENQLRITETFSAIE